MDQHPTQIYIAALADAVQFLLATSRVLSRHHPNPSGEIATATKSRAIADGGHSGGGDQRAEAWDLSESPAAGVIITYTFNLVGDRPDVDLDLFPLLPHALQQPAQTRAQVSLGIFDHGG